MKNYVIVSDSTCDLNKTLQEKYQVIVIPAHFMDKDGVDKKSFNDWSDCDYYKDAKDFYKSLKQNPSLYTTAAPSMMEIYDVLKEQACKGNDIIIFCISSTMSGTNNLYRLAKEKINEEYKDCNIYIVDTLRFGPGIGLMCINASIKRSNGISIEEVYDEALKECNNYHQMGWLDDLGFVAKKGRITQSKAFFGQLIGIKPLGEFNNCGLTTILAKAKGDKEGYAAILDYVKQTIINPEKQIMLIAHSTRERQALLLKEQLEEQIKPLDIYIVELGPSCGINVGPGLMACYYVGKPISDELKEEKELMEAILNK